MKNDKKYSAAFLTVMAAALMILIFGFSSQGGTQSSGLSLKVTRFLCRIIFFDYESIGDSERQFLVSQLHGFVRKLAHFSIYMLLGTVFYLLSLVTEKKIKVIGNWGTALLFSLIYAFADEIHQYFTPGRAMRFTDVIIDSCGALTGIIAIRILILTVNYIHSYFHCKGKTDQR